MGLNIAFKTRQDYIDALNGITVPLAGHFSAGRALCHIGDTAVKGYSERVIGLETFARPLWGIVPLVAGGGNSPLTGYFIEGIKNGTNPAHPEYWGTGSWCNQMFVEMAALALGLLLYPQLVWDPLSVEEKRNFNQWLLQINDYPLPQNNWQFFKVLVNAGLKKVGGRYSQQEIDRTLAFLDTNYLGDGWYSDGVTNQRDYYVPFAMHFYSLIYAVTMRGDDPERAQTYIARSKQFAEDFVYFFNDDGKALPFGRSLTYRFAQCAFFSALAFAGEYVHSWGVMRGIIGRHMRWWFQKPIFDCENKLTLGYVYPNLLMCEGYNAPGSPYWALKSFLILALGKEHPFWQAEEEPLPPLDAVKPLPHAFMLIDRRNPNDVTAYTAGQYADWEPAHADAKYGKFAYSSQFGFSVPKGSRSLSQCAPDSMLAFVRDDMVFTRKKSKNVRIGLNYVESEWSPMAGIRIKTRIEPYEKGHIRTHEIQAEFDCVAYECGFSLPMDDTTVRERTGKGFAEAENEFGRVYVELLAGEGIGQFVEAEANTNLMYNHTGFCCVEIPVRKGANHIKSYVFVEKK